MPFNLVRISQQDPRWKNLPLGNSSLTIGSYGCALTSVAMYLSGFNYPEDSASLNTKLKSKGGFVDAAIVWGSVTSIYPAVKYKNLILSRDTDAPIDLISTSVLAGQPVLLEVDSSPNPGLQTHWVLAYNKVGQDFLILDPWPYPTDTAEVSLMARYSQGRELKRSISAAIFYECQGSTGPVTPPADGYSVMVFPGLEAGLRLRAQPSTSANTLTVELGGSYLKVLEAEATARPKVGVLNQWLQVQDGNGRQGYVAAWYVENVVSSTPSSTPGRSRKSVADGLDNIGLAAPTDEQLTLAANASATTRLVADIWNRYGGLLGALSGVLNIQPGVAVAVLAIESGGQAYGPDGRMVIRFENHIFYQYWGKAHADAFSQYFRFNTAQPWTGHQWKPASSQSWIDCHASLSSEWDVFNLALSLDETAAKMSISMGAPQIMGFNYAVVGYSTVKDMFADFSASERAQVAGFFDFLVGVLPDGGAIKALQTQNYKSFASTYNGTGQADYYGNLVKTAFDAFTALQSTPPVPQPPIPQPPVQNPPDSQTMYVVVNNSVAKPGLNLRKQPSTASEILGVLPIGSKMKVLDNPTDARSRIGKAGQWIQVKDEKGRRGYVGATYVKEA